MQRLKDLFSSTQKEPADLELHFRPRKILLILEFLALLLAITSFITQALIYLADSERAAWYVPLVDVDHELSLPTIYSVILFFCITFLLIFISKMKFGNRDQYRWHWFFLCLIIFFLGLDEGASIHELISSPTGRLMGEKNLPGFMHYAWVLPAIIVVVVVVVVYIKFLFSLPKNTQRWLILAGLIYISGALGLETLGAIYAGVHGIKNLGYSAYVTIEEFMEMSGLIMALYALLDYVDKTYLTLRVRLQS